MKLTDKVAVITGASRGIGKAIALDFARQGASVVLASRKQTDLESVKEEITAAGGTVLIIPTHTGKQEQCESLIAQTLDTYGKVNILVNNAATNPHFGTLLDSEFAQWQKIFEVNIMGYFWMSKYAAEAMQKNESGGKIINMASVVAFHPGFMMGIYSLSKAAVVSMTKTLAVELAPKNIQVNAIAPGIIKTKFASALWDNEAIRKKLEAATPAGQIGDPDDITAAAVYLASDESRYTTGIILTIDGGMTITSMKV